MSVSGSKPAFSPKPPPQPSPQGGLAKQGVSAQDALVGSNRIEPAVEIGKGSTATAAPMAKTKPLLRKPLPVPVLERLNCPRRSVLPLLSPEQELTGKGVGKLKQRLAPLHRRKSDVDGRFRRRSRNLSSAQRKPASSGQEPSLARRRSTTPDASRPSTTSNTNTAREGVPSSRTSFSSETATDPGADQAQLKARLRVMEWKRRRAEELESQQEEQATQEHRQQAEAETEAARKLAAARAEEAERRILAEHNNSADAVRASEAAERWAKASRERERRRAEIYAINAVMRAAFEKEFKAYSLEQENRVTQASAPDVPDLQPAVDNVTPPRQ
ncbi:expressed unknown protein [Ectocarpus siliculosus]|uniref:Uncharacterized protein n=1 Tax=Ectocarpus siliculosus TaxID=2880 RepID=D7FRM1_ECTSI|nr:expressed unknown protein [Ectocarpus siliculosus]|eukprot:CBJ30812.1 expressed unknown protein [Ectocarpus siliculosus]